MKTGGFELIFRAGRERRYSRHDMLRPLVGLFFFFLNPNLYSARVQLGTEADTYMNYVICSNMCVFKSKDQRGLVLGRVRSKVVVVCYVCKGLYAPRMWCKL
jgi:hypothetical protein